VTLAERLQRDLTSAIRERDELRRDTLRMVLAAAYNQEKASRRPLTEDELLTVVVREVKTRRESVEAYRKGAREELAAKEEAEIAILNTFLPETLDEEGLRQMVRTAIAETGASSARDLGRVMGVLAPRTRGRADGRQVSAMVAQELARADLGAHAGAHADDGTDAGNGPRGKGSS
jgi:uncharacterized protein YqeY